VKTRVQRTPWGERSGEVQLPRLGRDAGGAKAKGEIYIEREPEPPRGLQGGAPGRSSSRERERVSIPTDNLIPQSPTPGEQRDALGQSLNLAPTRRTDKEVAAPAEKESWSSGDFRALAGRRGGTRQANPSRSLASQKICPWRGLLAGGPWQGPGGSGSGQALSEAPAVAGLGGAGLSASQHCTRSRRPTARRFCGAPGQRGSRRGSSVPLPWSGSCPPRPRGKGSWGRRQGRLGRKWGPTSGRGAVRSSFLATFWRKNDLSSTPRP
jgi:hypothetical protein